MQATIDQAAETNETTAAPEAGPTSDHAPDTENPAENGGGEADATAPEPPAPILDWDHNEDGDSFFANSNLRHPQDRGSDEEVSPADDTYGPLVWQIDHIDEKWAIFESHSELTGIPDNQPKPEFDTLAEAKSWCEAREKELTAPKVLAESVTPEAPSPLGAGEEVATPDSVKVGSVVATSDARDDHLRDIEVAEMHVASAEQDWEASKAQAKSDKDAFDAAVEKLRKIIRRSYGAGPLFEQSAAAPAPETIPSESVIPEVPAPPIELPIFAETPAEDESWRLVPLSTLTPKIGNRAMKALASHNPALTTMGELGDWQKKKGDFWATDIAGLGAKGKSEIEEAQMGYWTANPRQPKPVMSETETSAAAEPTVGPVAESSPADPAILETEAEVPVPAEMEFALNLAMDDDEARITYGENDDGTWCWAAGQYSIGVGCRTWLPRGRHATAALAILSGARQLHDVIAARIENSSGAALNRAREFESALWKIIEAKGVIETATPDPAPEAKPKRGKKAKAK